MNFKSLYFGNRCFQKRNENLLILIVIFIFLNGILFHHLGIKVVDDSPRYLEYASAIKKDGFYIDSHNIWYITYVLFILITTSIYNDIVSIIVGQYIFSFLGLISLYHASLILFKKESIAFFTGFLFLIFFKMSLFNSYILTESLYVSLTCISLYFLTKFHLKNRSLLVKIFGIFIIGLTVFTKPTGIALLGAFVFTFSYVGLRDYSNNKLKWLLGITVVIPILVLANQMVSTFGFIENYKIGELIYGVAQYSNRPYFDFLIIERPENMFLPTYDQLPLVQMISFIYHQPVYWLKLFFGKLILFFAHVRPFWSIWHNLFSILFLMPLYAYFIKGICSSQTKGLKIFALLFIVFHAISVGMMSVDWDGRFLLPVLPILLIISTKSLFDSKYGI